jgi:hypothetical protein
VVAKKKTATTKKVVEKKKAAEPESEAKTEPVEEERVAHEGPKYSAWQLRHMATRR